MTVTPDSCEFVRQETSLRIEVRASSAPHAQCGSGAEALKAIGNEAQACTYQAKSGWMAEQVVGRVRDQAFLVRYAAIGERSGPVHKVCCEGSGHEWEEVFGMRSLELLP